MYKPQDKYFKKAKQDNYRARSVYKLQEIDVKHKLIKPSYRILDLGCVPGSWLQYCAQRVGGNGLVVGVDVKTLKGAVAPNVRFVKADVSNVKLARIKAFCPVFDLFLSDMAPATSGIKSLDQERSLQLVYTSWEMAKQLLKPGGDYLAKVFQGEGVYGFLNCLKADFARVRTIKPKTSGRSRLEIYILAQDKRSKRM